jgi:very-short-patch-repair endonuclease
MGKKRRTNITGKYLARLSPGSKASIQENARSLRQRQTDAEEKLWALLRNRQLKGKKFRRQHAIADYVVDFYCHECKVAVELDRNVHTSSDAVEYDQLRTNVINEIGVTVLRFCNHEVMNNPDKVLHRISEHLQ